MPRRTKIYKIVSDETLEGLEKKVNELLASGWDLVGGIIIVAVPNPKSNHILECYAQAMSTTL